MSDSIKVELEGDIVHVHYRRPDWDLASRTILYNRENPPDGYRLERAAIVIRSKKGGRAVSLRLSFRHVSQEVKKFDLGEAYRFFRESAAPGSEPVSASA